jgi:uncharacterized protein (UPF0333 family)
MGIASDPIPKIIETNRVSNPKKKCSGRYIITASETNVTDKMNMKNCHFFIII